MLEEYGFDLEGTDLEDFGCQVFTNMGLKCIHRLRQAQLKELNPSSSYSKDQHLEFDYLIPYNNICLVGEITDRGDNRIDNKYSMFRRNYNILANIIPNEHTWRILGVPEDQLRYFRQIREFRGFFISKLEEFDVRLSRVDNILICYWSDWRLIIDYSRSIGPYAKNHFIHRFNIDTAEPREAWTLHEDANHLIRTPGKRIASGEMGLAEIFTFEASPYDLLEIAEVYRKDGLNSLTPNPEYQRPLMLSKLTVMRKNLPLNDPDFMFPNSVLVILSNDCDLDEDNMLRIPKKYGAISVIDGQHRLFSYADDNIKRKVETDCKIMVTAIRFVDTNASNIFKYSAKTFIEINTNQTPVQRSHLDAIAYEILGETTPRALAAEVILRANKKRGSLYGIFQTNQTSLGIVPTSTVLYVLKSITNLSLISRMKRTRSSTLITTRKGYENLYGVDAINEIESAEIFIDKTVNCLIRYFNLVKSTFSADWPIRGRENISSLRYAKMIAGFVGLLRDFILKGHDWVLIENDLESLRHNLLTLRKVKEADYTARNSRIILFHPNHPDIPDAQIPTNEHYKFLKGNLEEPISIQLISSQRRR